MPVHADDISKQTFDKHALCTVKLLIQARSQIEAGSPLQAVADPAMGGQGGRPPHWPKFGAGIGGATQTRGQIFT